MLSMDAAQREYITSERFIYDDLVRSSQRVLDEACRIWESGEKLFAYAIAWPTHAVRAKDGTKISRAIVMELPKDQEKGAALRALVETTGAYGLLLVEQKERAIVAKFETAHGARAWTVPIERHGDRLMLGDQRVTDDTECIGLLWSPSQGRA
jgi:hypothetical protein